MGIRGLGKFLAEYASSGVRQKNLGSFVGQTVAIDASMSLYQFMIAIRDSENFGALLNEAGESTSHISGFLTRVVKLLENGIKPVYVFDGEPVKLKSGELARRSERRAKAEVELKAAQEADDKEKIKKFMGRTVRITKKHNEDIKELLRILGIPYVEAPTEAEAQCAAMTKDGIVNATATEDADALTFGSPILIRNLTFTDMKSKSSTPILTFELPSILSELKLTMDQFIDFCILCGCDYCDTLKGIGPKTAYKLIQKHNTIENVCKQLDASQIPVDFAYAEARNFFRNPQILTKEEIPKLSWNTLQEKELRHFLITKHNFNAMRVETIITRIHNSRNASSQTRLEAFFAPIKSAPEVITSKTSLSSKRQKSSPKHPTKKSKLYAITSKKLK